MSAPPSASLRSLFSELEQLFQTETEARVSTSVLAAVRAQAEHLNQSVRRLRQASGFSEIAAVLCDASAPFAAACAVFQVAGNAIAGERLRGADAEAAARFQELRFTPADAHAFAGAIESHEPVVALATASEVSPAVADLFGHAPGDKASLFLFAVDPSTLGILYASGTVESAALELLTQVAAAVLEAQLPKPEPPPPAGLVRIELSPTPRASAAPEWDDLTNADRRLHLRAQRFARTQVAEMSLYHAESVNQGRARNDLYSALREPIDAARAAYREQFIQASPTMLDYLHRELVRTLARENPAALGESYPGPLV